MKPKTLCILRVKWQIKDKATWFIFLGFHFNVSQLDNTKQSLSVRDDPKWRHKWVIQVTFKERNTYIKQTFKKLFHNWVFISVYSFGVAWDIEHKTGDVSVHECLWFLMDCQIVLMAHSDPQGPLLNRLLFYVSLHVCIFPHTPWSDFPLSLGWFPHFCCGTPCDQK